MPAATRATRRWQVSHPAAGTWPSIWSASSETGTSRCWRGWARTRPARAACISSASTTWTMMRCVSWLTVPPGYTRASTELPPSPLLVPGGPAALVFSGAVTVGRHIAWALRLTVGGAEQRFVGRSEVGGGQAIWVEPPDLGGHGDGDLDVLAAAGGVEGLGIGAEFGLPVQRLVADREQGGGGDPVTKAVRSHGRGFHIHGERARNPETVFGHRQMQLPVPVRGG